MFSSLLSRSFVWRCHADCGAIVPSGGTPLGGTILFFVPSPRRLVLEIKICAIRLNEYAGTRIST